MYLVFTRMPGENYRRRPRSLLLCLCYVFRTLINSLFVDFDHDSVNWLYTSVLADNDSVKWLYTSVLDDYDRVNWLYTSVLAHHDCVNWLYTSVLADHDSVKWLYTSVPAVHDWFTGCTLQCWLIMTV